MTFSGCPIPNSAGPAYYNENDPYAAQWLRNLIVAGLITPGFVDERSIADVRAEDLKQFSQCHFFAGIGGWAYALQLAGWPDAQPVWTGSCPCQALSSAARGRNTAPDLWPEWQRLIASAEPRTIFGEQVAHDSGWLDRLCDDMEALDYQVCASVLPAVGVGADHLRPRIYFAGHANRDGKSGLRVDAEVARLSGLGGFREGVVPKDGLPRRMGVMRAFGNAIVPQLAAAFVSSFMEAVG